MADEICMPAWVC